MSTTTYESLAPELRLALRMACEAADPAERGRQRAERVTGRLLRGLCLLAGCVGVLDVALLLAG